MKRGEKQERVFLFEGFTVDGKQVYPLSAGRRIFLKKMGNPLIHDDGESELSEDEASAEMLFACTKKGAELGSYLNNKISGERNVTRSLFRLTRILLLRTFSRL